MKGMLGALSVVVVGVGSIHALGGDEKVARLEPAAAPRTTTASPGTTPAVYRARGLSYRPASPELAAQLGVDPSEALVVVGVEADSPAATAELECWDVILMVDREAAGLEKLREKVASDRGLALRVVRAGVVRDVALVGEAAQDDAEAFLSRDALAPDHPFRRVEQLESLREAVESRAERNAQRARDLDQEARQARADAKVAARELHEKALADVQEYFDAREARILAMIEASLPSSLPESRPASSNMGCAGAGTVEAPLSSLSLRSLVAPLVALRLEVDEAFDVEAASAVDEVLLALRESLKSELSEHVEIAGAAPNDDARRSAQRRFARIGESASNALGERIAEPWSRARREVEAHRERLSKGHDARMQRTANTLDGIRGELVERVTSAFDRAGEEFSGKLRRRLGEMDVPAPGEIEGALADVGDQVEQMARRFVTRTTDALATYADRMEHRETKLVPTLAETLIACGKAVDDTSASIDNVVAFHLSDELEHDATWHARARVDATADALARDLSARIDAGCDAMRAATVALRTELNEERVVSDDAWNDLERSLGSTRSEVANDCWKLDGPHLDGRFPKRAAGDAPLPNQVHRRTPGREDVGGSGPRPPRCAAMNLVR